MKSPILFCTLLLFPFFSSAQFTLTGTIQDETSEAIEFASVLVVDSLSSVQKGTITDELGQFQLELAQSGNYQIRVSFIGYEDLNFELFLEQSVDIGVQQLSLSSNLLEGVTVRESRPIIEQVEDKLVFHVASSPMKEGYDGLEILQRAPHIWVDGNGTITMRQERATILINGRIVNWSSDDLANYLSTLRSEDIQSIQIQNNLSANVDAESSGGVINIILKRKPIGLLANWRNYYTTRGKGFYAAYTNLNLDYGKDNWNIYANYNYTYNTNESINDNRIIYESVERLFRNDMISRDSFRRHNLRLGGVLELNDKHTIGGEIFGFQRQRFFDNESQIRLTEQTQLLDQGITLFEDDIRTNLYNATLNYTWILDSLNSQVQFFADYSNQSSERDNLTVSDYDLEQYTAITERNLSSDRTDIYALQLDVEKRLPQDWKVEFGSKITFIQRNNLLQSDQLDDEIWQATDRTTAFDYTENIWATYASVSKALGEKYFLKAGARLERTDLIRFDLLAADEIKQNYWTLVPNLYLSRDWIQNSTLSFSYAKRIRRPPFVLLNNNVRKINDFRFELGNPDLRPELIHRFEWAWNIKKHQLATYYHLTDEAINGIYFLEGEVAFYKKFNEGKQTQRGLSYNYSGNLLDWWFTRISLDVYHRKYTNEAGEDSFQQASARINLYQNLKLNATTNFDIACYYLSPTADAFYVAAERYGLDLILQKFFFNKKLNCRVYFNDVFNSVVFANERQFPTFRTTASYQPRTRRLTFWMTYTFSNQQKVKRRKNRSDGEARGRL